MKFLSIILAAFLIAPAHANEGNEIQFDPSLRTIEISSQMSETEAKVRNAAVRVVTTRGGHGSGSLIQYKDLQLVLTAQHIADEVIGTRYRIIHKNQ